MPLLKKPLKKTGGGVKKLTKPGKAESPDSGPKRGKIKSGGSFAKAKAEKEAWDNRIREPWRLSIPIGGSYTGYFLDDGEPWSRYEHKIGGGPNSRAKVFPCIKDTNEACPLCDSEGKEGNYTMFLTICIPVMKYKRKNERGREEEVVQKYAKRLVPIGMKMSGKYQRLYERHGTFKGMKVRLTRDGQMDPGSGNDVEFIEMLDRATMQSMAKKGVAAITQYARENKKDIKELDTDFLNPYDYDKVMAAPKAKELAKMAKVRDRSGGGTLGDEEDDEDFDAGDDGDWGDE